MRNKSGRYGVRFAIVHLVASLALFVAAPAAAADKLVVAFGDSLSAGYGLKPGEGFPDRLERALRASGIPVKIHNAGVSGDTSAAGRARLAWVLGALKAKPDLVILELGANDMLRGLKPAETRANLDAMMAELQRRKVKVLIAGMLASPNMGAGYAGPFNAIYPALAKKYGAPLYPFFLTGVTGKRGLMLGDGMHPNAKGVDVVVAGILPTVKAALR